MREQLKYPVGMQSFPNIRRDGYLYVDKTEYIIKLQSLGKYFFLGRPRRFGKSLFLSTLEAYYQGERDLFEGLAIYDYEKSWTPHEVLHLDFTGKNYSDSDSLDNELDYIFTEWEDKYAIQRKYNDPELRFRQIIKAAYLKSGREVVLLTQRTSKRQNQRLLVRDRHTEAPHRHNQEKKDPVRESRERGRCGEQYKECVV